MFLYLDSWYIYYYVSLWNSNCSKKRKSSNSKFHFQRKKKRKKITSKISSQESYISKHIHAPFAIQEKSRAGAKRGQHPLFPRFFFPTTFLAWNRFASGVKRKMRQGQCFQLCRRLQAAVSRVTSSMSSMQLCSTTVERGEWKKKKERKKRSCPSSSFFAR